MPSLSRFENLLTASDSLDRNLELPIGPAAIFVLHFPTQNPSRSQNRFTSYSLPPRPLPNILLYQEDQDGRWILLYLNIQRYIPPDLSLELWEYTYDAIADCYLFDDTSDDIISYQHKLRFRLPSPIIHPCPTLIERLEKVAEAEENHCLGTITVEYLEFFK